MNPQTTDLILSYVYMRAFNQTPCKTEECLFIAYQTNLLLRQPSAGVHRVFLLLDSVKPVRQSSL